MPTRILQIGRWFRLGSPPNILTASDRSVGRKMGLDSVELVLNAEEHFGIEIPDHVAETLFTVGDLHGFIVAELNRTGRPTER